MMTAEETRGYVVACRLLAHVGAELASCAPQIPRPQNGRSHFVGEVQTTALSLIEAASQVFAAGTGLPPEKLTQLVAADILQAPVSTEG